MAKILLPSQLDYNSLAWTLSRAKLAAPSLEIDFEPLKFIEPSGLVSLAAFIQGRLQSGCSKISIVNARNCQPFEYLQRMDLFRYFGLFEEENFTRHPSHKRFAAMKIIDQHTDCKEAASSIVDTIADESLVLKSDLHTCLSESFNNIVDHAEACGFAAAQSYIRGQDRRYSIAIADPGIGILQSLKKNRDLSLETDADALDLAVKSGITGAAGVKGEHGGPRNVGQGLFHIDRITESIGGKFSLLSGDARRSRYGDRIDVASFPFWSGTIVVLNFFRSRMNKYAKQLKTKAEIRLG